MTLNLGGLNLTVLRYQFSDSEDFWDGNWLVAEAVMKATGSRVIQNGPFVRTDELERFAGELSKFLALELEHAKLECLEPYLAVSVEKSGSLGAARVDVTLRASAENQLHQASFASDFGVMGQTLADLRRVIELYPVRGTSDD